jgi:hypothetical protein
MAAARLTHSGNDRIDVVLGPRLRRVLGLGVGVVLWAGVVALSGSGSRGSVVLLLLGAVLVPVAVVLALRALRPIRRTLARTPGRLMLDGEPLELARVELRVRQWPLTRVPTGYRLSLWVMTSSGPEDIPLGRYKTLLDASAATGVLEEFLQRANVRQPGRTGV